MAWTASTICSLRGIKLKYTVRTYSTHIPIILSDTSQSAEGRYLLDSDHNIVPASDWVEWCKWMAGPLCPRWVTVVPPTNTRVFTFFAGMPDDQGAFFRTSITGSRFHGRIGRAFDYAEAEAQHARVVNWLGERSEGDAKGKMRTHCVFPREH